MSPVPHAAEILAKYGVSAAWSPTAIRVAVMARLPRSDDRRRFSSSADGCETHAEFVELAARTLNAFEERRTPLRPPSPSVEDGAYLRALARGRPHAP